MTHIKSGIFSVIFSIFQSRINAVFSDVANNIKKTLFIGVLLFFSLSLIIATWLCVLGLLYVYYTAFGLSPVVSLLLIMVINILLLVLFTALIIRAKKHLFFTATRRQLARLLQSR